MTKRNTKAKIAAIIALIAIISSVIWTWVLVIMESYFASPNSETSLTQEQLQELLNSYSWTTSTWSETTSTWINLEISNTWTTN